MEKLKEIRHIVRIAGKDLNGNLPIYKALTKIKGIGTRMALSVAIAFEHETGTKYDTKLGTMDESLDKKLEGIVLKPTEHNIPEHYLNRQHDLETGASMHQTMADLDFALRKDLQRLNEIKSYRGLRQSWGLTVRGQHTKSSHRGKGGVIGVLKRDAKLAAAAAKTSEKKK